MNRFSFIFLLLAPISMLHALSIEEHIATTLESNPKIQQRISEYRSAQYDLEKAYSGYKPTVDITAGIGPEHTNKLAPSPDEDNDLIRKEASVVVTENLFNGFSTTYDIKEQTARLKTSRHFVLQEADTLALEAAQTYLNVATNKALLDIEHDNVRTHERIFEMTRQKMDAGLGRRSDLEQTEARMAQAYANYIAQQNNYQDAIINFERVHGSIVTGSDMSLPESKLLPEETLNGMTHLALRYNPTLVVEQTNIESQTARYQKEKSSYYPTVDAELSADYKNNIDGIENDDRAYRAMLRLYYNLYNGGADEATRRQNLEIISSYKSVLNDQLRAVTEKLKLGWMSYQYYVHRIRCLELYAKLSRKTADSYAEEYHLGRRSLLDLLNVELEANGARQEVIRARNQLLFSYYRILEASGLLSYALAPSMPQQVDLELPEHIHLSQTPTDTLTQYGELDEYIDITTVCRQILRPVQQQLFEPEEEIIDRITVNGIHFNFASAWISPKDRKKILPVVDKLHERPELHVEVHGHTDNRGRLGINQELSEQRAKAAQAILLEEGISPDIITTFGHASTQPVAENNTTKGRRMNRRIEFILKKPNAIKANIE